jgi:hypothetical protein
VLFETDFISILRFIHLYFKSLIPKLATILFYFFPQYHPMLSVMSSFIIIVKLHPLTIIT